MAKLVFNPETGLYEGSDYLENPAEVDQDFCQALFYPKVSITNIYFYIDYLQLDETKELRSLWDLNFLPRKRELYGERNRNEV